MKCEMYWGDVPCESENTILVNVKLASGGDKKIYMCPGCHYKYFGKRQRRPTHLAPDVGQARREEEQRLAQRASDEATCSAKYHLALAEKGDTYCGVCGQPLLR